MKWTDITIAQYKLLPSLVELPEGVERNIKLLSILTGVSEDTYLDMPIPELQKAMADCEITNVGKEASIKRKYIVNGKEYILTPGASCMTAGQYIDYVNTLHDTPNNYSLLLAILCVPKGCRYNNGYDLMAQAKDFEQHFKWCDVLAISFFFLNLSTSYTKAMLNYLRRKLKRMIRKEKAPERIEQIRKAIEAIETAGHGIAPLSRFRPLRG